MNSRPPPPAPRVCVFRVAARGCRCHRIPPRLLDGGAIADEIKRVRPELPIVMLADHVELPVDALKSVDALVVKSDGPHFLLATIHFVLKVKPLQRRESKLRSETPAHLRRTGRSREAAGHGQANAPQSPIAGKETPFSPKFGKAFAMASFDSDQT